MLTQVVSVNVAQLGVQRRLICNRKDLAPSVQQPSPEEELGIDMDMRDIPRSNCFGHGRSFLAGMTLLCTIVLRRWHGWLSFPSIPFLRYGGGHICLWLAKKRERDGHLVGGARGGRRCAADFFPFAR